MIALFILFVLLASPMAFKSVRSILGTWVSSADGLPTFAGVFLHAFVFVLVLRLLKYRPGRRANYEEMTIYDPSVSRATNYGMTLAAKGPDDLNKF
jgi:hypothetical protein